MDTDLLIEVHQYYINSLKSKIENLNASRDNSDTVSAKCITVYISNLSCIDNDVEIFNNFDANVTHTSTKTKTPLSPTNLLPFITYTFSEEIYIKKIVIKRPDCTSMLNAYIKVCDSNNNCTYESVTIQQSQCINKYYTYTIPNREPTIQ